MTGSTSRQDFGLLPNSRRVRLPTTCSAGPITTDAFCRRLWLVACFIKSTFALRRYPFLLAFRNILIHAYDHVDLDEVWNTATLAIPDLILKIEPLVPSEKDI